MQSISLMRPHARHTFQIGTLILLLCAVMAHAAPAAFARETSFSGRVVSIADGDTLTVLVDNQQHRIRLHGIDAPEKHQAFGTRAKEYAGQLAFGQTVTVIVKDTDRYGRTVAVVVLPDGRILNHELVRAGLAWWFTKYARNDAELARLEKEAREAKRGLWADPDPTPPWEFRRIRN